MLTGGRFLFSNRKQASITQSLSLSSFHQLNITEILLKGLHYNLNASIINKVETAKHSSPKWLLATKGVKL